MRRRAYTVMVVEEPDGIFELRPGFNYDADQVAYIRPAGSSLRNLTKCTVSERRWCWWVRTHPNLAARHGAAAVHYWRKMNLSFLRMSPALEAK